MRFESPEWLMGLWAVPLLAAAATWAIMRRRALLRRFADEGLLPLVAPSRSTARPALRALLMILGLIGAVLALARPQWGEHEQTLQKQGRDVCFVLDVSRSMLAEDLVPNRLERAKLWISDVLDQAQGDRVAIVAFAGHPLVKCPLTLDYGFAKLALEDTTTESVSRGGTLIGDAIRMALTEVFETEDPSFKDLILITDGEDQESFPVDAAKLAGEKGVRIIAIGLGDENEGRPIPITDPRTGERTFVKYKGERVLSKLDGKTLRDVAAASRDGIYLNVSTGTIELDSVYKKLVRQAEQKEQEQAVRTTYVDRFQFFLGPGVGLVLVGLFVSERRR